MNFESYIIDIKNLVKAINNRDVEVFITYRGYNLGVVKPWHVKCDMKEVHHENHLEAVKQLYQMFTEELKYKISSAEEQAIRYRTDLQAIVSQPGLEKKPHEVSRRQEAS